MAFRLILYLVFVLVAAPLEIILDLWSGTVRPDPTLIARPVAQGLVYIYAFTLIVETWFRLEQRSGTSRMKPKLKALQAACICLILFFMVDYMGELRPRILAGRDVSDSVARQIAMVAIALACSVWSFAALELRDKNRPRRR
jgi:hypothetical protein